MNADGLLSTGQGFLGYNMFTYCLNNPVNMVDYDGRTGRRLREAIARAAAAAAEQLARSTARANQRVRSTGKSMVAAAQTGQRVQTAARRSVEVNVSMGVGVGGRVTKGPVSGSVGIFPEKHTFSISSSGTNHRQSSAASIKIKALDSMGLGFSFDRGMDNLPNAGEGRPWGSWLDSGATNKYTVGAYAWDATAGWNSGGGRDVVVGIGKEAYLSLGLGGSVGFNFSTFRREMGWD